MPQQSTYLRYLPQVLWSSEGGPEPFLGQMLCVFEKILTGIADDVPIRSGDAEYPPIRQLIDELPKLFKSWGTRPEFLPWLASWVALELEPKWTEYQKRKLITEIVSIYRLRGLEPGLHAYLDIYVQTPARPRIAIDDGSALLRAKFAEDGMATLCTVAQSQVVSFAATGPGPGTGRTMLIRPSAIAVDSANHYFVVDQGVEVDDDGGNQSLRFPALWRVSMTGEVPYKSSTPLPLPEPVDAGALYRTANAAVVDNFDRCNVISVGDPTSINSVRSALIRLAPPEYKPTVVIAQTTNPKLPAMRPVDMVLDADQNFVILDRGAHLISDPPSGFPAAPKIVVVREGPGQVTAEVHALPNVAEPTALLMEPGGTFIVADASDQFAVSSTSKPGDLLRLDPGNDWSARSLLADMPEGSNPLVFPTALAWESKDSLLVCDVGLRWRFEGDQSNRSMAEPAAIFRVDLSRKPPVIVRITNDRRLVSPTKMMVDRRGNLIIADRGEALHGLSLKRNWRARPSEFGVVVHFSRQRPTSNDERNRIRRGIGRVLEEQKPCHASWWLKSQ
jgi:phage tail-like protein